MKTFFILFIFALTVSNLAAINYYVNDGVMDGTEKWCTQPGNDGNSGTTTNQPKLTIANLVTSYALGSGDIVYIGLDSQVLAKTKLQPVVVSVEATKPPKKNRNNGGDGQSSNSQSSNSQPSDSGGEHEGGEGEHEGGGD